MQPKPSFSTGRTLISVPCHFGEWIQGRLGSNGPVVLITLMARGISVSAQHRNNGPLACHAVGHGNLPFGKMVRLHRSLGLPMKGQTLTRLPFPPGLGTGMSTASLIAHARAAGFIGSALSLAQATIAAEGASDPLMFRYPDQLLWASRQGKVQARLPSPFHSQIVGGFFGPPRPTRAMDQNYDDVSDLLELWPKARTLGDMAALSSESAVRCARRRETSADPMPDLVQALGALGWATSHSGAARSLIFPAGAVPEKAKPMMREAGLYGIVQFTSGGRWS